MSERHQRGGAPLSVVIAGGGTGGHLYPGIAVAQRDRAPRAGRARVVRGDGARTGSARDSPRGLGRSISFAARDSKASRIQARLRGALLIVPGGLDAWRLLSKRRPSVVIGVGGYSSGPVVLLAALRGIPTLVLEQNARPGLTNRLLARVASAAAVAYDDTLPFFHGKGFLAGNPVRAEFFSTRAESPDARKGRRRLLILGGSQGAHVVNLAAVAAAAELARRYPDLEIVHQTGERDLASVRERYADGWRERPRVGLSRSGRRRSDGCRSRAQPRGRDHTCGTGGGGEAGSARAVRRGDRRSPTRQRPRARTRRRRGHRRGT